VQHHDHHFSLLVIAGVVANPLNFTGRKAEPCYDTRRLLVSPNLANITLIFSKHTSMVDALYGRH
jgi:hypothetical protein